MKIVSLFAVLIFALIPTACEGLSGKVPVEKDDLVWVFYADILDDTGHSNGVGVVDLNITTSDGSQMYPHILPYEDKVTPAPFTHTQAFASNIHGRVDVQFGFHKYTPEGNSELGTLGVGWKLLCEVHLGTINGPFVTPATPVIHADEPLENPASAHAVGPLTQAGKYGVNCDFEAII